MEGSAEPFGAVMKGAAGPLVLDADLSGSAGPAANLTGADGDVVAQLVERRPRDPMDSMTRGSNPVRGTITICKRFPSQNVVLTRCRCAPPPCVNARLRTYSR